MATKSELERKLEAFKKRQKSKPTKENKAQGTSKSSSLEAQSYSGGDGDAHDEVGADAGHDSPDDSTGPDGGSSPGGSGGGNFDPGDSGTDVNDALDEIGADAGHDNPDDSTGPDGGDKPPEGGDGGSDKGPDKTKDELSATEASALNKRRKAKVTPSGAKSKLGTGGGRSPLSKLGGKQTKLKGSRGKDQKSTQQSTLLSVGDYFANRANKGASGGKIGL